MTVGDTVSLLPRELGPDIPTSAATAALASSVGITWTSELLTVTGVDPAGPVSVQPNSLVSWGDGVAAIAEAATSGQHTVTTPAKPTATVNFDDLKGSHAQAARLTEWLKLALDQPDLLEKLGATANLGVLVSGPAGVGKATLVRAVCADRRLVELDGPEVGALRAEDRLKSVSSAVAAVRDGGGVLLITDIDALLPSTAEPVATLILTELRNAVATPGVAFIATSAVPDGRRPAAARARPVRPGTRPESARRRPSASSCWKCCCAASPPKDSGARRNRPSAHRVSSWPTCARWCARRRCGRRHEPAPTASRRS